MANFFTTEAIGMLTELVKALEEKRSALEREIIGIRAKQDGSGEAEEEAVAQGRLLARINERSIKEYKVLWQSFSPPGPFPCPFCYVFQKKVSPLKPLPRLDDVEPVRCTVCGETFEIPVELLYA